MYVGDKTYAGKDVIEKITNDIRENRPVIFAKYGDGEYRCASGQDGCNIDNDMYTIKKSKGIRYSFSYLVQNCENAYIGAWFGQDIVDYFESLVPDPSKIKWADYHTIIIYDINNHNIIKKQLELYKAIQSSTRKKILVCNPLLEKAQYLLNTQHMINVPFNNWYDTNFDNIFYQICSAIGDDDSPMVIISCGMAAKILIAELHKKYPNGTFLDTGSALDYICTTKNTRCCKYNYQQLYTIMQPLLPGWWHDPSFEHIYSNALMQLSG